MSVAVPIFTRQRGETIVIGVTDDGASAEAAPLVTCFARATKRGVVDPAGAFVRFLPSFRAEATAGGVTIGKGWTFTLDAGACAAITFARAQIDWRIIDGQGAAFTSPPAILDIVESATVAPAIAAATINYPSTSGVVVPFVGLRTVQWILDPPAGTSNPVAIIGPPGQDGSGGGGGSIGAAVRRVVNTGGAQTFAFAGSNAMVFVNGAYLDPTLFTIAGGNLTISGAVDVRSGDIIVTHSI